LQELAHLLLTNENASQQQYVPKIMKPPDGAHTRVHSTSFPNLNPTKVQEIINEGLNKQSLARYLLPTYFSSAFVNFSFSCIRYNSIPKLNQPRIVPLGQKQCELLDPRHQQIVDNSARRLEVRFLKTLLFNIH